MKTKAYSKDGLAAAAKLDPKEQAKVEASDFLSGMIDDLEQQVETLEAEMESIQATMKKGRSQTAKAERIAEIERVIGRHKWHQKKQEMARRQLENGRVEAEQVNDLEETIRYYVTDGMNEDFIEDDEMYDDLDLVEDEGPLGVGLDNEKSSSQDNQSVQEDITPEPEPPKPVVSKKAQKEPDTAIRRPSTQAKSPLPALATLNTPLAAITAGATTSSSMKPASLPMRPAGEGLKYASAAAAAAASDKNNVGIAPLPPPPGAGPGISPLPPVQRTSATSSPASTLIQPVAPSSSAASVPAEQRLPAVTPPSSAEAEVVSSKATKQPKPLGKQPAAGAAAAAAEPARSSSTQQTNGVSNGPKPAGEEQEEDCVYHLPSSLKDLVESYEISKRRQVQPSAPATIQMMTASQNSCPDAIDAEAPRKYRPDMPMPPTGSGFPRDPLPIFEDTRLYSRIDPDTLFYVFYYKQGTAQQYMAAKALKDQSWRFHKQYQTWFQRHEEPKNITEEFEQGTYRFFDYESTW